MIEPFLPTFDDAADPDRLNCPGFSDFLGSSFDVVLGAFVSFVIFTGFSSVLTFAAAFLTFGSSGSSSPTDSYSE